MILEFPDFATLRLALTGGFVPAAVAATDCLISEGPAGRVAVEFKGKIGKKAGAELEKLGVTPGEQHAGEPRKVGSWPELFPLEKLASLPQLAGGAAVLFELAASELAAFVHEMLRLGNDRQQVRWLDAEASRALLRAVGPPYYTILRAMEPGGAVAYAEAAPRVWVELGYRHPFATMLKVPEGSAVFLAVDQPWRTIADAPFADIYDVVEFELPASANAWEEPPAQEPIAVPLSLVAGNAAELPELWVLRGDAVAQLDELVRDSDERLVGRLKFAVGSDAAGQTVIVLRATASKLPPPVPPLTGVIGYRPFYKLPNLYVPAGKRVHPALRRDAVRTLLANDPDRLVWLAPGEAGAFVPETISEDSFRPLEDWVVYIIGANAEPLAEWVEATTFAFESFICGETSKSPKPPGEKPEAKKPRNKPPEDRPLAPETTKAATPETVAVLPDMPMAEERPVSEWVVRRQELEREFLEQDGPIDAPERVAIWPRLAEANAGAGDAQESALCRLSAIWGDDPPPRSELDAWAGTELGGPATLGKLEDLMKLPEPTAVEARQFVACALRLTHTEPLPTGLAARLPAVGAKLEANEPKLPVRATWLLAYRLSQLAGSDALGLARTRDRLLQRLIEEGLRPERDLPFFLRGAGLKDSERLREVRDQARELHTAARQWAEASLKQGALSSQQDQGATLGYIDLFFAFSLAKLGEATHARQLAESGRAVLSGFPATEDRGIVGNYLAKAFTSRIEAALAGRPTTGPLEPVLAQALDAIHKEFQANSKQDNPYRTAHYAIVRMREQSRVLEQLEKLNPYSDFLKEADDLRRALNDLPRLRDPATLARTSRDLYRNALGGRSTAESRFQVLMTALLLAGRVGEAFTLELLALVPETLKGIAGLPVPHADAMKDQGKLLERALYLAANYDRREVVQQIVDLFITLTKSKTDEQRFDLVNVAAPQCLRSLRKMGLRDETDRFLQRLQESILAGQPPTKLRERYSAKPDQWGRALQSLLTIAGGWRSFGLVAQAQPILDLARAELIGPSGLKFAAKDFTALAQGYIGALGHGPVRDGLAGIAELFAKMDPAKVINSFTTARFYSRFHLNLIEEVTLVLVSEDFSLGSEGRRWLEEDEFVIRRRVHADVRQAVAAG